MDSKLRKTLTDSVHRRALALARMTDQKRTVQIPDTVIAYAAKNLLEVLCALLGQTLLEAVLESLYGELSEKFGVCRYCRKHPFVEKQGMCNVCWKQMEEDDKEITAQSLMESLSKGKPS